MTLSQLYIVAAKIHGMHIFTYLSHNIQNKKILKKKRYLLLNEVTVLKASCWVHSFPVRKNY